MVLEGIVHVNVHSTEGATGAKSTTAHYKLFYLQRDLSARCASARVTQRRWDEATKSLSEMEPIPGTVMWPRTSG